MSPADRAELEAKELSERIRAVVDSFPSRVTAAEVAQVSPQQIHNLMTGKNNPTLMPIARMAIARGFRLEWVATGDPPMMTPTKRAHVAPVLETAARLATTGPRASQTRIVLKIYNALRFMYAELGREPRDNDLQEAAMTASDLVAVGVELEQRPDLDSAAGEIAARIHRQAHRLNAPTPKKA